MAPAALVFAGKSVAIPAISFLVNKAFSYLNEYFKVDGYDEIQRRLEQALPKIQAVFQVINPERIKEESSALDAWLWQLRDAYEEAEDAVDEVEYYKLKEKAEDLKVSDWGSSFAKMKHRAIKSVMHASVLDKTIRGLTHRGTLKKLQKAVEGLDKAASGVEGFLGLAGNLRGSTTSRQEEDYLNKDRETGSMITAPKVFGRQEDLERLIGWLTKPSVGDAEIEESKVSVVSIVGHGGMGKTTLAQLIHNDDTINKHFNKVIWACVSTSFNAKDVISKMLENAGWQTTDVSTLESSQRFLGKKLRSVKFLLILDDVWEDKKDDQWEKLLAPLREGEKGSKILLTTRIERVAEMAENVMRGENKHHKLQGLDECANIELFRHHAFCSPDLQDGAAFNQTGEKIAKSLRGCPLVTKVVAAHLRDNMRLDYWNEFLTQSLQHFCGSSEDIMNVLRLSYYHLPPKLQTCFRFCSLFTQDYRFNKNDLVEMWVNSGLISHNESETCLVKIGEEYLVQLIRKSFLDLSFYVDRFGQAKENSGYYIMHDLMHDLATNVSFGECVRIADVTSLENVVSTVRHIRVEYIYKFPVEKIKKISRLEHLRTIIIKDGHTNVEENIDILNAVEQLVAGSKSLRLLETELWHTSHFASKLAKLKHLRCIKLKNTYTAQESMSGVFKLYHLTTLKWKSVNIGSKQVRDVGYLDCLRHVSYGPHGCSMVPIGRLTSLQFLPDYRIRRVKGYSISVLKDLGGLRSISVHGLENVHNQEEAKEANMKSKKYLESLHLQWWRRSGDQSSTAELIADSLEPHANLRNLSISGFGGRRIPHWITEPCVENLVKLNFNGCAHIEELPNLEMLLKLEDLRLDGLTRLRRIGPELNTLGDGCMELFLPPRLHTLDVRRCFELEELPLLPPTLVLLEIDYSGLTRLPRIAELQNQNNETVSSLLKEIKVSRCQSLNSLVGSLFEQKQFMGTLCEMSIIDCEHLESAPLPFEEMNGLGELFINNCPELRMLRGAEDNLSLSLSSLKRLKMGQCGDLELLLLQSLQAFTNLSSLSLRNCLVLESLPSADVFRSLMSLRNIEMNGCRNLSSLGGLESVRCLKRLSISNCSKLKEVGLSLTPDVFGCLEEPRRFMQFDCINIDHPCLVLVEPLKSLCTTTRLDIRDGSEMLNVIEPWLLHNCTSLRFLYIFKASFESLPPSIRELSSLKSLCVYESNHLRSLSSLPSSLLSLFIMECHPELRKKVKEHGSIEWNKICQIPNVQIGDCCFRKGEQYIEKRADDSGVTWTAVLFEFDVYKL
ncbi:hypothetical protein PVAP13_1NG488100 [Panicum virgatum]|uniref:Uncharacterized protein n=1 Tax=Panicum virgatum TaxID=38727 RepID=A0A8T0XA43_PANVG|nr:hypothetical protein PVAP13_1NG488100 [Panicum virgatum]